MGVQDDIFDVRHALKRKPEATKAFERFCDYFYELEIAVENQQKALSNIRNGALALKDLLK